MAKGGRKQKTNALDCARKKKGENHKLILKLLSFLSLSLMPGVEIKVSFDMIVV